MAVASSGSRIFLIDIIKLTFLLTIGTGEFLMKSLFSKSISDVCAADDLTPEFLREQLHQIFLSKIFHFENLTY